MASGCVLQIAGLIFGGVGMVGTLAATAMPQWRVSAYVDGNIVVFESIWEGLWMDCISQLGRRLQCKFSGSALALPPPLEACRALMCAAVALAVLAFLLAVAGVQSSPGGPGALSPAVPGALSPAVPAALSPAVPGALSPAVPAALSPAVPAALSPAAPAALSPAAPGALSPAAPAALSPAVPAALSPAVPGALSPAVPAAGAAFLLAGMLALIPVSWAAAGIVRDFHDPRVAVPLKRELGAALFVGWASGALLLAAGAAFCRCWCRAGGPGDPRPGPGHAYV